MLRAMLIFFATPLPLMPDAMLFHTPPQFIAADAAVTRYFHAAAIFAAIFASAIEAPLRYYC